MILELTRDEPAGTRKGHFETGISLGSNGIGIRLAGHVNAQHDLAGMSTEGRGVRQDFAEAAAWCRKAASQGLAVAQRALHEIEMLGLVT